MRASSARWSSTRGDAQAHNNRGLTKLKLGDREGARADFRRALELEPALKEAEENLRRMTASEQ